MYNVYTYFAFRRINGDRAIMSSLLNGALDAPDPQVSNVLRVSILRAGTRSPFTTPVHHLLTRSSIPRNVTKSRSNSVPDLIVQLTPRVYNRPRDHRNNPTADTNYRPRRLFRNRRLLAQTSRTSTVETRAIRTVFAGRHNGQIVSRSYTYEKAEYRRVVGSDKKIG